MLLLIEQSVHAALSGDLASYWGRGPFAPLVHPEVVWPAIYHHDDGWQPVDRLPPINPETKRPRSFLHTPVEEAHVIWTRSIDWAGRISPFAQYLIAEHFMLLRQHSHASDTEAAKIFLHKYEELCSTWRDNWESRHPCCSEQEEKLAVHQLQFFDWLSIWLCIAERTEPHTFEETPGQIPLKVQPQPGDVFRTNPWPWTVEQLHVSVSGYLIPDRDYRDSEDVKNEMTDLRRIDWQFLPG